MRTLSNAEKPWRAVAGVLLRRHDGCHHLDVIIWMSSPGIITLVSLPGYHSQGIIISVLLPAPRSLRLSSPSYYDPDVITRLPLPRHHPYQDHPTSVFAVSSAQTTGVLNQRFTRHFWGDPLARSLSCCRRCIPAFTHTRAAGLCRGLQEPSFSSTRSY